VSFHSVMLSRFSGRILSRKVQRPVITNLRTFASTKLKDKNAPERPPNAYNVFVMERMPILKKQSEEQSTLGDLAKACALEWKALSENKKQEYQDRVKGQADEYKKNVKAYKQTEEYAEFQKQRAAHAKREKLKEFEMDNAPKRARTAYIFWTMDAREKFKKENPDASVTDMVKMLGEAWNKLPKEEKVVYEEQAKQDKVRYEEEKALHQMSSEYQENESKKLEYLSTLKKKPSAAKLKESSAKVKAKLKAEKTTAEAKAKEKQKTAEAKAKEKAAAEKAKAKAAEAKAKEKARALKVKEKEKAAMEKAKAKAKADLEKKKAKAKREREKAKKTREREKAKEKREKEREKLAAAKEKEKLKILALKQAKSKKVAASS